jgi:DNA-binding transcriptional MocR family regulator
MPTRHLHPVVSRLTGHAGISGHAGGLDVRADVVADLHVDVASDQAADAAAQRPSPLYLQIAQRLQRLIEAGALKPGNRLPSVRDTAAQEGVSMSTAVQAFRWLEERGLVQARPKAGYFVAPRKRPIALPTVSRPPSHSLEVKRPSRSDLFAGQLEGEAGISFGGACPRDRDFFDEERVRVAVSRATRVYRHSLIDYTNGSGELALREAVVHRALYLGCQLRADDVTITSSCIHAISLCLRAVTQPGDVVALESPTHFGFLDLLESLNLRALEIPTHPRTGVSLPALQLALDTQPVKAMLAVPTLSNPLGAVMPHADKRALVNLLASRGVPLIEDVVFNDLMAADERRKAAKAFDADGWVMVCGSFSKTVAPGIRLGWVDAGRWHDAVATLKRVHGGATNVVLEQALADLLTQSSYEARMRRISAQMKERLAEARLLIATSFPRGTRISDPSSGYTLWVELPAGSDSLALFHRSVTHGITFGPGALFSATDRFNHCMRLSFAGAWGERERRALRQLGRLAAELGQDGLLRQAVAARA